MFRFLVLIASVVAAAHAYSTGAPASVCKDMIPGHPADPQIGASPYKITINKSQIHAGDEVKVTLESLNGDPFKGFLAKAVTKDDETVGTFVVDSNDAEVQTLDCPGGAKNAATHKDAEPKNKVSIVWLAPNDLEGVVVFKATFVKDGLVFWVAQTSSDLTVHH